MASWKTNEDIINEIMEEEEKKKTILKSIKRKLDRKELTGNRQANSDDQPEESSRKKVVGLATQKVVGEFASEKKSSVGILSHEKYAEKFVDVMIESTQFETPSTIGVFAPWGSGKTHFITHIKKALTQTPAKFALHPAKVTCCFKKKAIPACCKLIFYFVVAILLMAESIVAITMIAIDQDTRKKDCESMATINITTSEPCTKGIEETYRSFWIYSALGVVGLVIILVLLVALCQRKVWRDCTKPCRKYNVAVNNSSTHAGEDDKKHDGEWLSCTRHFCLNTRTLFYMAFLELPQANKRDEVTVITVEFNAWLYSGCGYLWAGIVTTLGNKIEKYFGKSIVRISRVMLGHFDRDKGPHNPRFYSWICCKLRHKYYVLVLFFLYIFVVSIATALLFGVLSTGNIGISRLYIVILTSILALGISMAAMITVIRALATSTQDIVRAISNEMVNDNFHQELGFMHKIKEEVEHITNIINFMSRLYGRKFRVLLIIDDLDRCQPEKIMAVLEAVNLLLENEKSPYLSLLAIDPCIVLGAVEKHFDLDGRQDITHVYVNGYEYLKKIVHMPFYLPNPYVHEKQLMVEALLGEREISKTPKEAAQRKKKSKSWKREATNKKQESQFEGADNIELDDIKISPQYKTGEIGTTRLGQTLRDKYVRKDSGDLDAAMNIPDLQRDSDATAVKQLYQASTSIVRADDQASDSDETSVKQLYQVSGKRIVRAKDQTSDSDETSVKQLYQASRKRNVRAKDQISDSDETDVKKFIQASTSTVRADDETSDSDETAVKEFIQASTNTVRAGDQTAEHVQALMKFIKNELKDERLLAFVNGNPRTLKRVCNVILLALNMFRGENMKDSDAFRLMLVIIMAEQWPFRTSFLRQFYVNNFQKSRKLTRTPTKKYGDLEETYMEKEHTELNMTLAKAWNEQQHSVLDIDRWRKFLNLDYDPELFHAFIETYKLKFSHLEKFLPYAVNHDINIESVVERGMGELDIKRGKENKEKISSQL